MNLFSMPDFVLVTIDDKKIVVQTEKTGALAEALIAELSKGHYIHKLDMDINHEEAPIPCFMLATGVGPHIQVELLKRRSGGPLLTSEEALEARISWLLNNSEISREEIRERAINELQPFCSMDLRSIQEVPFDPPDLGDIE